MIRGISAIINSRIAKKTQPSPFSVLKTMEWTNLDPVFPDSKKVFTHIIGDQLSDYMKKNGITYARITTASRERPVVRHLVLLPQLKEVVPELRNVNRKHPDISQILPKGCCIINPRFLNL